MCCRTAQNVAPQFFFFLFLKPKTEKNRFFPVIIWLLPLIEVDIPVVYMYSVCINNVVGSWVFRLCVLSYRDRHVSVNEERYK